MYHLVFGIFYLMSLLPLRALYLFGDGITFFLRDVVGYRKKVVMGNLQKHFPEKTPEERRKIAAIFTGVSPTTRMAPFLSKKLIDEQLQPGDQIS